MGVLVWHGASRMMDPEELKKYDVVLTTYAVLESCFRKQQSGFKRKGTIIKEKSPLHAIEWERIVVRGHAGLSRCFSRICTVPA
jgi:DNA repair protein RAD16